MIRLSTLFCMVMIQLCCTAENAYARRGISIPIFFGYSEEMVDRELRRSSLIYSKLISTLPTDDERLAYAKTCLASIDERLRVNVGKND